MAPDGSLFQIVERLAKESGDTLAAVDAIGKALVGDRLSYRDLCSASRRFSGALACRASSRSQAISDIALWMRRGNDFYVAFLAAIRLQVPVIALSTDLPDKNVEQLRNREILRDFSPVLVIVDDTPDVSSAVTRSELVAFREIWERGSDAHEMHCQSSDAVLCYQYTGGTTGASRCAKITHKMALWEVAKYPEIAKSQKSARVLQQHSVFWMASMFGEVDIALAFGCALVFAEAWLTEDLAAVICTHEITIAGLVPTFLDAMEPAALPSLRLVFTWGEALQVRTATRWAQDVHLIDLLISTECYLSLYADWSSTARGSETGSRPPFRAIPGTQVRLLPVEGQSADNAGELLVAGPMVSPGYVDSERNAAAFLEEPGCRWYRTRDCLEKTPCGGFVFTGRADDLMKVGGVWVDVRDIEQRLRSIAGVQAACLRNRAAFVQLSSFETGAMQALRRALPADCGLFLVPEFPRHPATGKINSRRMESMTGRKATPALGSVPAERVSGEGLLSGLHCWYYPLLLLCVVPLWQLRTNMLTNAGSVVLHLPMFLAMAVVELLCRWVCLSYMLLTMFQLPWMDRKLSYMPMGQHVALVVFVAVLPNSLLCLFTGAGALRALWSGRLLSWPWLCLVGFPLWTQETGTWWTTTNYRRILQWYYKECKESLPLRAKQILGLVVQCHECKAWKNSYDGFSDAAVDENWYCKKCWDDYNKHWQCTGCKKWVSRGRHVQGSWMCLRCSKPADADAKEDSQPAPPSKRQKKESDDVTWVQNYNIAPGPVDEEPAQVALSVPPGVTGRPVDQVQAPLETPTPQATPQEEGNQQKREIKVELSEIWRAAAEADSKSGADANALQQEEKSPQWKLVEKAVGFDFKSTDEQLLIDSLRFTKLTSALLREEGKQLPRDALKRCASLGELLREIESLPVSGVSPAAEQSSNAKFVREEHKTWGMMWRSTCRWTLHRDRPMDEGIVRTAMQGLMQRHVLLRSEPAEPLRLFTEVQKALSVLQLWRLRLMQAEGLWSRFLRWLLTMAAWGFKQAWPRARSNEAILGDSLEVLSTFASYREADDAIRNYWYKHDWKPPFKVVLAPYGKTGENQGVLLQVTVTHMFSDGFCIVPLMADLASLVVHGELQALGSPTCSQPLPALANPLVRLQARIMRTIDGDHSLADAVTPPGLGKQTWRMRVVCVNAQMPAELVQAVKRASSRLAVADEMLMLAAIGVALAKVHKQESTRIMMVAPQRDGPGESDMVGLFADQRVLDVLTEGLNYAGVALSLHHVVKERLWRAPPVVGQGDIPFVNFEWTDFEERHGFTQVTGGNRWETRLQTPCKIAVDQPDRHSWRLRCVFDDEVYKQKDRELFFSVLENALRCLIEEPLALV